MFDHLAACCSSAHEAFRSISFAGPTIGRHASGVSVIGGDNRVVRRPQLFLNTCLENRLEMMIEGW
jgi:hypothetical protein